MNKSVIAASLLAYLSCAPQETIKAPTPVIEIHSAPIVITEKDVDHVKQPLKEPQAKKDTDFIVKTLEEKLKNKKGITSIMGELRFYEKPHSYVVRYAFRHYPFCSDLTGVQLFDRSLEIEFRELHQGAYGTLNSNYFTFFHAPPFYPITDFKHLHTEKTSNWNILEKNYESFPKANRFYGHLVHYIAEELKLKLETTEIKVFSDLAMIDDIQNEVGERETKLRTEYDLFLQDLPAHKPIPEHKIVYVLPCDP